MASLPSWSAFRVSPDQPGAGFFAAPNPMRDGPASVSGIRPSFIEEPAAGAGGAGLDGEDDLGEVSQPMNVRRVVHVEWDPSIGKFKVRFTTCSLWIDGSHTPSPSSDLLRRRDCLPLGPRPCPKDSRK